MGVVLWSGHAASPVPAVADLRTLRWDDGSVVEVAAATRVFKADAGSSKLVQLESGEVTARVAPQPDGASFTVLTAEVRATAIGTVYRVQRRQTGTVVSVEAGRVLIRAESSGSERVLGPGESLSVAPAPPVLAAPSGWEGGAWIPAEGVQPAHLASVRMVDGSTAMARIAVYAAGMSAHLVPWRAITAIELDLPACPEDVTIRMTILTRQIGEPRIGMGAAGDIISAVQGTPVPGCPGWRRVRLERDRLVPSGGEDVALDRIIFIVPAAQQHALRLARAVLIR